MSKIFKNLMKWLKLRFNIPVKEKRGVEKFFDESYKKLFPGGKKQEKEEAKLIMKFSNYKLSFRESNDLLLATSFLFGIEEDKNKDRMIKYIDKKTDQKLNNEEAKVILNFIISKFYKYTITYEENSGDSIENAIVIHGALNEKEGVYAEYEYLSKKFGERGKDWKLVQQSVTDGIKGKYYDEMEIILSDGTKRTICFDITEFFRKWKIRSLDKR